MKNVLFILLVVLSISHVFAQSDSIVFNKNIEEINTKLSTVENKVDVVSAKNNRALRNHKVLSSDFNQYQMNTDSIIEGLQKSIIANSAHIDGTAKNLNVKIVDTEESNNQSIIDLHSSIWQNMIYWIIAVLIIAVFVIIVFTVLKKQISKLESTFEGKLEDLGKTQKQDLGDAKKSLEQELKNTRKILEKELKDARKILGEDLINTRKVLSEDLLKTRDVLSEDLQFSKKTLEESIKEEGKTFAKEINDAKLILEKEDAKLDTKLTELQNEQLKVKEKLEDK